MFTLDQRLQNDTHLIGRFPLCQVLLLNDSRYPWVILVPSRQDVLEIYHLAEQDRIQLGKESAMVAERMADHFRCKSMNVAALGNVVAQYHQHHVVRNEDDPAWPGPVWGHSPALPYSAEALESRVNELKVLFAGHFTADLNKTNDAENYIYW